LICMTFLFFEAAFGICLGCKFYSLLFKDKAQYCAGGACEAKSREGIQKTSKAQMFVVLGSIAFIFLAVFLFNGSFSKKPHALFGGLTAISWADRYMNQLIDSAAGYRALRARSVAGNGLSCSVSRATAIAGSGQGRFRSIPF
jgi:hypothetical protein